MGEGKVKSSQRRGRAFCTAVFSTSTTEGKPSALKMSDSCSDSLNEAKLLRDASAMSDGSDVESEGPDFRREFVLTPFVRGLKLVAEQVVGAAAVVAARRGDTVTIKHGVTAKEFEEVRWKRAGSQWNEQEV